MCIVLVGSNDKLEGVAVVRSACENGACLSCMGAVLISELFPGIYFQCDFAVGCGLLHKRCRRSQKSISSEFFNLCLS